jgi:hypothetical protein
MLHSFPVADPRPTVRARGLVGLVVVGLACSWAPLARADVPAEPAPAPVESAPALPASALAPAAPSAPAETVPFGPGATPARPTPSSTPRRAAPPPPPADDEDERPKPGQWYGYQTLAVDAASLALAAMSVRTGSGALGLASLGTYVIGPPIVHFAHGHVGKGFADLGLRLGLPVGGALVGVGIGCALGGCGGGGDFAGYGAAIGGLVGGASGGVAAMILDWALLSREPGQRAPRQREAAEVTLRPSLAVTPTGGALGLGGAF